MPGRIFVAALLAVALSVPAFAGDIVAMPTGNTVAPGNFELNAIYWNRPGNADITIGEAFFGVYDRVELVGHFADVDKADSYMELNAYVTLIKETAKNPSLIVGCTNITGEDWLGGVQFANDLRQSIPGVGAGDPDNDDASLFVVSSFNITNPAEIDWQTPFVRLHAGYGDKAHGGNLFGGVQFKIHPRLGGALMSYDSMPAYMVTYQAADWLELTGGIYDGDTFYRAGGFWSW